MSYVTHAGNEDFSQELNPGKFKFQIFGFQKKLQNIESSYSNDYKGYIITVYKAINQKFKIEFNRLDNVNAIQDLSDHKKLIFQRLFQRSTENSKNLNSNNIQHFSSLKINNSTKLLIPHLYQYDSINQLQKKIDTFKNLQIMSLKSSDRGSESYNDSLFFIDREFFDRYEVEEIEYHSGQSSGYIKIEYEYLCH